MIFKKLNLIWLFIILITPLLYAKSSKPTKMYIGEFSEWKLKHFKLNPNQISIRSTPDQIRVDPFNNNIVWFTQPNIHGLSKFNLKNNKFTTYRIIKKINKKIKYRPDGLIIDKNGILWFGEQLSGTIGRLDPKEKKIKHFKAPYKNANLAIPTVDHNGYIWITDHKNNKILKFDPKKKLFYVFNVPTPDSWVVDLKTDSKNRIWYSSCLSNIIGMIDSNRKTIIEYSLPPVGPFNPNNIPGKTKKSSWKGTGPAFLAIDSKDKVWFTLWATNKIGVFNPKTGIVKYYALLNNPAMAAITITNNNIIFFSTYNLNAIVMFNPKNDNYFHVFPIPTPNSGQKDGITVDNKAVVWFTETTKNKIGRLKIFDKKVYKTSKINHYYTQELDNVRVTTVKGFIEKANKTILKPIKIKKTIINNSK